MKRGYSYGIVGALIAIGLVATLGAQPPAGGQGMGSGMNQGMRGQGMGPGGPRGGPMAALKLTAEQQKQLQALMQTERQTRQATMEQARDLRKQLHETIYGGSGNVDAAVALATRIATIEAEARIHMQVAAAAILTAEQKKILLESGMEFPMAQMGPGGRAGRK